MSDKKVDSKRRGGDRKTEAFYAEKEGSISLKRRDRHVVVPDGKEKRGGGGSVRNVLGNRGC